MAGRSSFGFLNRFGRSADLKAFDDGLRQSDVHPAQVVEGVKLAAVRLVRKHEDEPVSDEAHRDAAFLIGFCVQGRNPIAHLRGDGEADALAQRVVAALEHPASMDAELILLALHAGLVAPAVADEYGLAIEER